MGRRSDGPDPKQARIIEAIATGADAAQAAEAVGVDRETPREWLDDDPSFVAGLNRAKRERADRLRAEVRGLGADRRHHQGLGRPRWV